MKILIFIIKIESLMRIGREEVSERQKFDCVAKDIDSSSVRFKAEYGLLTIESQST